MAIYHLEAKVISRGAGRSAVAASAYLSCSQIYNDYDGIQHDTPENEGLSGRKYFFRQSLRLRGVTEAFCGMRWRKTKRPRTAALPVNLW